MEVDGQEDSEIPSAKDCLDMCETFAEFTETDKAMAMFFLQDHSWNLEVSILRLKSLQWYPEGWDSIGCFSVF